jgi:hypothetical protein
MPAGFHCRRETTGALSLISVVFMKEGKIRERNEGARFMVDDLSQPLCHAAT